jgi:hypothetical protein
MSKQLILISWLIILISACTYQATSVTPSREEVQNTQPAPSNSVEAQSTLSIITAWTDLAATKDAIPRPTYTATPTALDTATAVFSICPGAPGPYAAIGNQVTVVAEDVDKLKLRSKPTLSSETVVKELNRFTQLQIVGGPMCVTSAETGISYWLWKVKVQSSGKIGWVAEGDRQNYFIESNAP